MADRFVLFVSCVPDQGPVTRFGTGTTIGAERRVVEDAGRGTRGQRSHIEWDWRPDEVVAISEREHIKYRREYTRALANGSLRQRNESDWRAQSEPATIAAPAVDQRGGTPAAPETAEAASADAPPSAGVDHADPRRRPKR